MSASSRCISSQFMAASASPLLPVARAAKGRKGTVASTQGTKVMMS
jgi:hypothetical protein